MVSSRFYVYVHLHPETKEVLSGKTKAYAEAANGF